MQVLFGNKDVTDLVPIDKPFTVSIDVFGDPAPGLYKFLEVIDPKTNTSVFVGEGDEVKNIQTVFENVPASKEMAPLLPFVENKHGLEIGDPSWWLGDVDIYARCARLDNLDWFADSVPEYIENVPGATFRGDVCNIPFKNESLDFVVAAHVLERLQNPLQALREMSRVLKVGGHVILALTKKELSPNSRRPTTLFRDLLDEKKEPLSIMDRITPELLHKQYDFTHPDALAKDAATLTELCKAYAHNRLFHVHVFDFNLIQQCLQHIGFHVDSLQLVAHHQMVIARKKKIIK